VFGYADGPPGGRSYFWIPQPAPWADAGAEPRKLEENAPRSRLDLPAPPPLELLLPGRQPELEGDGWESGDPPPEE
jgi:hypothetical protein